MVIHSWIFYLQAVLVYCGRLYGSGSFSKHQPYIHAFRRKSERRSKTQSETQHPRRSQHTFHGRVFWQRPVSGPLFWRMEPQYSVTSRSWISCQRIWNTFYIMILNRWVNVNYCVYVRSFIYLQFGEMIALKHRGQQSSPHVPIIHILAERTRCQGNRTLVSDLFWLSHSDLFI